jgi:alpha-glucosidase
VVLKSPNDGLVVSIQTENRLAYSVSFHGKTVLELSPIALALGSGEALGARPVLKKVRRRSVDESLRDVRCWRKKEIPDRFNEATLEFEGFFSVVFRAYDDGAAYRFRTAIPDTVRVVHEESVFRFTEDAPVVHIPKPGPINDGEGNYVRRKISEMPDSTVGLVPLVVELSNGLRAWVSEADLFDYPGLYLRRDRAVSNALAGVWSFDALREEPNGWTYRILKFTNWTAETAGTRAFPWRTVVVAESDAALADCDMIMRLASPPEPDDYSWVKPGKLAWDWWYDWNLENVGYKSEPASLDFYKTVIDFAAAYGLEYIEVSVGWSLNDEITTPSPTLDMRALMAYARSKGVGVFLWVIANVLERNWDGAFDLFTDLGVSGIKADFFDGDHQKRLRFYERVARECGKRKLMVYFHGAHKPSGWTRTFPWVVNYEGVLGNEYNKWSDRVTPGHCLHLPFLRNAQGPMDFTPGAMLNGNRETFHANNIRPMSQGTRCFQLAEYVVFFGTTQMVCDAPCNYQREPESMRFIASVPTVWDETRILDGRIGEFVCVARRSGRVWYLAAMADWNGKSLDVPLDFLGPGPYRSHRFVDGINADRFPTDYDWIREEVDRSSVLEIRMASGGGTVARFEPLEGKGP